MKRVELEKKIFSLTLNDSNPKWIWVRANRSRAQVGVWGRGHIGQTGLQSPLRWNGLSVRALFWKHKKQSLEFKLVWRVLRKALLERMKHSCKSHVKYSLGFFFLSLRNHPEVWECAREHDWYIISVSGLWSWTWTWPSHVLWKRRNIVSVFLFFCVWIYNN